MGRALGSANIVRKEIVDGKNCWKRHEFSFAFQARRPVLHSVRDGKRFCTNTKKQLSQKLTRARMKIVSSNCSCHKVHFRELVESRTSE